MQGIGRGQRDGVGLEKLHGGHQPFGVAAADRDDGEAEGAEGLHAWRRRRRGRHCRWRSGCRRGRRPRRRRSGPRCAPSRRDHRRSAARSSACRWCRWSNRCGRARSSATARWVPIGSASLREARSSSFSVKGRRPMASSPPTRAGDGEAGGGELVAIEARLGEEPGDLLAIDGIVGEGLLLPGQRLDSGLEHDGASSSRRRRSRWPPRRAPPSGSRSAASCSSARWARRPAVRASSGMALTMAAGKSRSSRQAAMGMETFIGSGRAQALATAGHEAAGEVDVHGRRSCDRRQAPGCARRADRPACAADGRSPASARRARGWRAATARTAASASSPPATRSRASTSTLAQSCEVPRMTGPQPRMPAATARLKRVGRGVVGHAGGDDGRRQAMLGDGDEQEIEKEALVVGRLRPVSSR